MLVLRRKAGEAIVLNGVITIHVLAVEGERVKLGISAPPEVVIVRSELLENQGQMTGPTSSNQAPTPIHRDAPRPFSEDDGSRSPSGYDAHDSGGSAPSPSGYSHTQPARYAPRRRFSENSAPAPVNSGPLRYR